MEVDLLDLKGNAKEKIELEEKVFNSKISSGSMYFKFINENANIHLGTAIKKNRGAVRGGGRKPWRQKGTGRARAGSIRSPLMKGGGRTFGGQRKVYKFDLPKKIKLKALSSTLTAKFKQGVIKFIDEIKVPSAKTKEFIEKISGIVDLNKEKSILIIGDNDKNLLKASGNVKNINIMVANRLKIIPLLNSKNILITKSAVDYINSNFGR